jgi:uncharacterized circularly permuted ATP-grasp superfamily protein/uncharacterized alpha-E superfamily protein
LDGYHPAPGVFDELFGNDQRVRPHWESLLASFRRLSSSELGARRESTRRLLREHGATYNVYSESEGLGRPWTLDVLPLLIPAAEWREVEAGLIQRARLLNLVLADIYGPQRLLKEGLIPPALLYANPAFLRPCHGIRPAGNLFLFFHAVDLARSPEGKWWVLSDRTQAPSGAGYALENRVVLTRVFPDEYRDSHVHRLADFFQTLRDTLRGLGTHSGNHTNVVLLTPGPYNETYFEHTFLARYLGFPLVEGGDLTVRDRRVFIKTLEGLQPVDVILRRIDDTFCDPLELRSDSSLGVPGLLEAARAGNVLVANAFGSGVVEAPALMAFLPGLCRHLLGEDLLLPSVATWWCGQQKELEYVREHLNQLVLKPALAHSATEPVFGSRLSSDERTRLLDSMQAAPFDFVGQELVTLSSAPVWESGSLEPRPMVLRACTCASQDGYRVMPGGLSRYSNAPDRLFVSMQSGGGSKDTWVLSDGPISSLTLLIKSPAQAIRLERTASQVPSRIADNLFWLGRYAERLEDTVRILRCTLTRLTGEGGAEETPELAALINLLVNLDLFPIRFRQKHSLAGVEREIHLLVFQTHRLGTLREISSRLRGLAFALRDRFSADTWNILNKLHVDARPRLSVKTSEVLSLLNNLVTDLAAFSGLEMENMTRGHAWRFLDIGRRLERAVNVLTLVQGALALEPDNQIILDPVLEIADSTMTYRRRYFAQPQWPPVLDLLLADDSNPRSLAFQVHALAEHAANLPRESASAGFEHPVFQIAHLREELQKADWQELVDGPNNLSSTLQRFGGELRTLSDTITHLYFSHAETRTG